MVANYGVCICKHLYYTTCAFLCNPVICVGCWRFVFVLIRFEVLNLKCLNDPIRDKLAEIVTKFNSDIDRIQNVNGNRCLA